MPKSVECGVLTFIVAFVALASSFQQLPFVPPGAHGMLNAFGNSAAVRVPRSANSAQHLSPSHILSRQFLISEYHTAFAGLLGVCALGLAGRRKKPLKNLRSSMTAFDPSLQEGVTEPFGFFDPLGFSKGKDAKEFRKLRVAEIKHGRVAMMASIGMVLPHFWKAPGFEEVPSGIGAVFTEMGGAGFAGLVLGAGFHELVLWKDDESKDPGDFGDPFSFAKQINVDRDYELNNGRMAMFAVMGQIVAELVTGKDAVQQLAL